MSESSKNGLHFGYIVAAGVFILMFPMGFILNAAGIFYTPVSEEFGISQTMFGLHIAITEATMALMLPTINKLFRKYDTRITITACMVMEGVAYGINSMAHSVWVFYVNGFILGCCLSLLIYLIIPVLINNWFVKNTVSLFMIRYQPQDKGLLPIGAGQDKGQDVKTADTSGMEVKRR